MDTTKQKSGDSSVNMEAVKKKLASTGVNFSTWAYPRESRVNKGNIIAYVKGTELRADEKEKIEKEFKINKITVVDLDDNMHSRHVEDLYLQLDLTEKGNLKERAKRRIKDN